MSIHLNPKSVQTALENRRETLKKIFTTGSIEDTGSMDSPYGVLLSDEGQTEKPEEQKSSTGLSTSLYNLKRTLGLSSGVAEASSTKPPTPPIPNETTTSQGTTKQEEKPKQENIDSLKEEFIRRSRGNVTLEDLENGRVFQVKGQEGMFGIEKENGITYFNLTPKKQAEEIPKITDLNSALKAFRIMSKDIPISQHPALATQFAALYGSQIAGLKDILKKSDKMAETQQKSYATIYKEHRNLRNIPVTKTDYDKTEWLNRLHQYEIAMREADPYHKDELAKEIKAVREFAKNNGIVIPDDVPIRLERMHPKDPEFKNDGVNPDTGTFYYRYVFDDPNDKKPRYIKGKIYYYQPKSVLAGSSETEEK